MWGRRRNAEARLLTEAGETLAYVMQVAEDAHGLLRDARVRLEDAHHQVSATLGFGDGLPVNTVRTQLAQSQATWDSVDSMIATYEDMRATWCDLADADFEAIKSAAEFFTEYSQSCASTVPDLEGATESLLGLRNKLLELRVKVAPIRERAHTSFAAAHAELSQAGTVQGRFALEARLNAIGDRLRALDAGSVEVDPDRKVTDWYRDVETEIADIRDAVLRLTT
ncbi:hypothetical protein WEB32_15240 [Streptomyces netropsis]|uniref:Phage-related tail protein n=1 Tax=Streptomyces netropsis TaxID=55404 RepID=A0A7W7PFL0_STRNE|nr:hypothetical protein [Streptomyces netropsis]MBB4886805.1 phage-related tail protein [Streptomyces netropsis]GGR23263.1 hypothetical protein GCM10010219_29980 [Streptomyces netropsis]